jgi:hypothetical protein
MRKNPKAVKLKNLNKKFSKFLGYLFGNLV